MLQQIRHDPRTVALLLVVPSVLIGLMAWIFNDHRLFDVVGPDLLGLFPFIMMFLVTSITTLRERRSGTLERLMTTPLGRFDFIGGYALAFGLLAVAQSLIAVGFALWVCGLDVSGNGWLLVLAAVANALLGTTLGLFASAFAATSSRSCSSCRPAGLPPGAPRWDLRPTRPDARRPALHLRLAAPHPRDRGVPARAASTDTSRASRGRPSSSPGWSLSSHSARSPFADAPPDAHPSQTFGAPRGMKL